jgi:uncharacterized RDD family membrane protein YckC
MNITTSNIWQTTLPAKAGKNRRAFRLRRIGRWLCCNLLAYGILGSLTLQAQPSEPSNAPETVSKSTNTSSAQAENPDTSSNTAASTVITDEPVHLTGIHHEVIFSFGHDVELKAGDTAEAVVVIFGSAKIDGKVHDATVAVWGNLDIEGETQDAVAVMGNLKAGPHARIHNDVVTVGGHQEVVPGAKMGANPTEVDFPEWLKGWVGHCVLLARPLAPQVGFVWLIALLFLLVYAFIAILVPRPVQACVNELNNRPATTCLIGLLSLVLVPLVFIILAATGLGLIVVPFLLAALFFAGLLGRVALLEWLGFRLAGQLATDVTIKPLLALLIGSVIIAILYLIPVIGLLTFAVISVWGLGAAMLAAFGGLRREIPQKIAPTTPVFSTAPTSPITDPTVGMAAAGSATASAPAVATAAASAAPPILPELLSYPRAGFWERMGAGFLDLVLLGIVCQFIHHITPPLAFLVAVAYFAAIWTWRATSIGGIVLGLKVVRLDGQPVGFGVALVRALAGILSFVVLFLGFLWITWDPDKQGWHDKIAGTVVLKLPRGTPLLCL